MTFLSDLDLILADAGTLCTATVNGTPLSFYGIFNIASETRMDSSNNAVIITNTTLLVNTTIANQVRSGQRITVGAKNWQVTNKYLTDDGSTTELQLMEL